MSMNIQENMTLIIAEVFRFSNIGFELSKENDMITIRNRRYNLMTIELSHKRITVNDYRMFVHFTDYETARNYILQKLNELKNK